MDPNSIAKFSIEKNFLEDESLVMTIKVNGKNIKNSIMVMWTTYPYILINTDNMDNYTGDELIAYNFINETLTHIVNKSIDKLEIGNIENNVYLRPQHPKMKQILGFMFDFVFPFFTVNNKIRLRDVEHLLKIFDDMVNNEIKVRGNKFVYTDASVVPKLKELSKDVLLDIENLNLDNVPQDVIDYLSYDLMTSLKVPTQSATFSLRVPGTMKPFGHYLNPMWYQSIVVEVPDDSEDEFEEEEESEEDLFGPADDPDPSDIDDDDDYW